ncbi:hypothetical protein B0H10DRAFT_2193570 [Mycena sp. CBHHK59/15]|nr:hypothetical protein B0H10DRAFT_2193570 [Mycena sp. CBHHK59/15]
MMSGARSSSSCFEMPPLVLFIVTAMDKNIGLLPVTLKGIHRGSTLAYLLPCPHLLAESGRCFLGRHPALHCWPPPKCCKANAGRTWGEKRETQGRLYNKALQRLHQFTLFRFHLIYYFYSAMAPDRNTRKHYRFDKVKLGPDHNGQPGRVTRQQNTSITRHDPTLQQLRQARLAYIEAHQHGDLITWSSVTQAEEPAIYHRPARETSKGTWTQMAASAFNNIPSFKGPQCPYAMNPFRLEQDSAMQCHYSKSLGWHFQAKGHTCEFILNIPPLGSSKVRLHGDESDVEGEYCLLSVTLLHFNNTLIDAGEWADTEDEEESFELMALDHAAAQQVGEVNKATAAMMDSLYTRPTSGSSLPPSSPPIPSSSSSPVRPSPHKAGGTPQSYFNATKAATCMAYDKRLQQIVLEAQLSGQYKEYPEMHPTRRSPAPPIMAEYNPDSPGVVAPLMTLMTSLCGQMLSQLNSTMVEGYHEHRKLGLCSNTPDFHFIPELYPELEGLYDMAFRTYPQGIALPNHMDKINTIVGRAWIAWNSRRGVPKDIWALISTAFTHCRHCDLIRTFVGDCVHRDENHICLDVGQGIISTIANGVGGKSSADRAMVVWKMN